MVSRKIILDVGGGTGEWSRYYRLNGYNVRIIDPGTFPYLTAADYDLPDPVHGILLAPPCTEFAGSGSRWWKDKDPQLLIDAVQVVRDMLALVDKYQPVWWALENPVGRLAREVPELGRFKYTWQPWEFGTPETKRTCMWGEHNRPVPTITVKPEMVEARVHKMAPGPFRQMMRSITPQGFSEAFYRANP